MSEASLVMNCTRCGAVHPIEVQNEWGSYPGTPGLGPSPVCPEIIPGHRGSGQVCRGQLVAVTI